MRLPQEPAWLKGLFTPPGPKLVPLRGGTVEETIQALADADCLVCGTTKISGEIIHGGKRLRLIQKAGLRYENIDVEAARSAGVAVCVTRRLSRIQIAEHALTLMLALQRKILQAHSDVIDCEYEKRGIAPIVTDQNRFLPNWFGYQSVDTLFGKTLGILGLGEIGTEVALRGKALGMDVIYYQRHRIDPRAENELSARYVGFEELLRRADVFTLCVPQTPETEKMISAKQLSMMKRSSTLINIAKGAIVDEVALAQALDAEEIAGAGLDVFCQEPLPKGSGLLQCKNVILTPHLAMGQMAGGNIGEEMKMVFSNVARLAQELELEGRVA